MSFRAESSAPRPRLPRSAHEAEHLHDDDGELVAPCLASIPRADSSSASMPPLPQGHPVLAHRLGAPGDEEGPRLPASLPPVVDAHVHVFPPRVLEALWRWFETHAWPIRYRFDAAETLRFLRARGVERAVALHYAHRPGLARALNAFVADLCRAEPRVHGVATVLPGEPGARAILEEGFALGLRGVKLHCHVQAFAPDAPELHEVYETCVAHDQPLVLHAGREPRSPAYPVDTYAICSAERVERVLRDHPKLRLCVPHLGADEFERYEWLLERHDNLWLDTTMMVGDYFPLPVAPRFWQARPDRILYGTDFPNLPYAWDREVRRIAGAGLREEALAAILGGTARGFFGLPEPV